mgnify:CR=1 FL=1
MVQLTSEAVGIGLSLESAGPPPASSSINADTGADGRFTIDNVLRVRTCSRRTVHSLRGMIAGLRLGIRTPVLRPRCGRSRNEGRRQRRCRSSWAGDNVSDLALTTKRGGVLSRLVRGATQESCEPLPNGASAEVRPAKGGGSPSMMQGGRGSDVPTWREMSGPFYLGINGLPDDWAVSQIIGGRRGRHRRADRSEGPDRLGARVVLTDRVTTISGTVQASPARSQNYSVVGLPRRRDAMELSESIRADSACATSAANSGSLACHRTNGYSPSPSIFWKKARNRILSSSSACGRRR